MNKRERQLIEEAARAKAVWQAKKEKIRAEKERARKERNAVIYEDYLILIASQPDLPMMDIYDILRRNHHNEKTDKPYSHSVIYHALKAHGVDMTRGRAHRERRAK